MKYLLPVAAALCLTTLPANAQQQGCAPSAEALRYLGEQHGEAPVVVMQTPQGRVFVFASQDGKTWTLLVERGPNLCIVTDGTDFRAMAWVSPGKGA